MQRQTFQDNFLNSENIPVIIELGCGPNKSPGVIGVDMLPLEGVDVVHNLEEPLSFIPDNSIDELRSSHLLEHVSDLDQLIREIHRVLKPGGKHVAVVPHFSNPYYYSDYTHQRFFGLYTFDYMASMETKLRRPVPDFYSTVKFNIEKRHLNFKSHFVVRNLFKQVVKRLVNLSSYTQELYEEAFCYVVPCSDITFIMTPVK